MNEHLDRYAVGWDSPSRDASGSMPLGNGDIGVNVWVEAGGDLLLLIGKTDAWDENSTNLKLGRIRLRFSPNPFAEGGPFRQTLRLRSGEIEIVVGRGGSRVTIRLWVDANHPVIYIEADGESPFEMTATLEMWRTREYTIKTQTGDLFRNLSGPDPYPTIVSPDIVLPDDHNRIAWCHH